MVDRTPRNSKPLPAFFNEERMAAYIAAVGCKQEVLEFLRGELRGQDRCTVRDLIATAEQKLTGGTASEALARVINEYREW
jgi:hypothetical protein